MSRWRLRLALGLGALLLSCAQPEIVRNGASLPYEKAADADLAQAKAALAKGDAAKAEQILTRFQTELGKSQRADEALFMLAEAQTARKKPEQAASTYRRLVEEYPKSAQNVEAALRGAQLYQKLGRAADGRAVIQRASTESADAATRAKVYRLDA